MVARQLRARGIDDERVLDAMARGETPKPGPQNGRQYSAPIGGQTTLREKA